MSVVDTFTNLIKGNPLETKIGNLILQATDEVQLTEDWPLFMHVIDVINNSVDGPKDAVRAFRRRFTITATTNLNGARHTLSLLDACVKNCGYRFHIILCNRDVLSDFTKYLSPEQSTNVPLVIQDKVMMLIQSWAIAFRDQVDLQTFGTVYHELVEQGYKFPGGDNSLIRLCSMDSNNSDVNLSFLKQLITVLNSDGVNRKSMKALIVD